MTPRRLRLSRLLFSGLWLFGSLLAPAHPAQAQSWLMARGSDLLQGYRITGNLRTDAYSYGNVFGPTRSSASWIEEGAEGKLTGYLWKPRFAQVDLGLEAFALQQITSRGFAPGRRFGFDGRLRLLPASIVPLTLQATSRQTALTTRSLPGQDYRTRTFGLVWRLAAPGLFPRLWLRLDDERFMMHTDSFLLPGETGLSRGQDFAGRRRRAAFDLAHDDAQTHLRASYEIEERLDSAVNSLTGSVEERTMVIESATLDGRADPTANLGLSLTGDLRSTRTEAFDSRRYFANAYVRYDPAERFRTRGTYTYQGDTLFGTATQLAVADGYYQWTDTLEARAGLQLSHRRFGDDAPVTSLSRQAFLFGALFSDTLKKVRVSATDYLSMGVAQANPGEAGVLLANTLTAQAEVPVAQDHVLSVDSGVRNAIDRSSFGVDQSDYRLGTHWVGTFSRGTSAYSDLQIYHERRNDRFRGFVPEQRTRVDFWAGANQRLGRTLSGSGRIGWSYERSSRDPRPTQTPNASITLNWQPQPRLSLRGQLYAQSYLYAGHSRNSVEAQAAVLWRVRAIEFEGSYRLRFDDTTNQSAFSQVIIVSLKRRFGASF